MRYRSSFRLLPKVLARALLFLVPALLDAENTKQPVTIDAVMHANERRRAVGTVAWSPDGRAFAVTEGGKLMLHEIGSGRTRPVIGTERLAAAASHSTKPAIVDWTNRRVSQSHVQWFPDSRRLLVLESGDLFVVDSRKGTFEQLTNTDELEIDPKLSPDGRYVSFRRGHNLFSIALATNTLNQLTHDGGETLLNGELDWVYPEELELHTAHWWSPDSRSIAYLQFDVHREPVYPQVSLLSTRGLLEPERYPKAGDPNAEVRLGVTGAEGGPTRWMNLGETQNFLLARVAWLPDSKSVAAVRLPRAQNQLDVLVANAETGVARVLLHEEDRYWINVEDEPRFIGNHLLWTSERSGFRHLYLYRAADGMLERQLTDGAWQINQIAGVDEANQRVLYTSTEASPLEQQVYSVRLDGSGKRRLSETSGTHSIAASPDGRHYLDTFSSLTEPPQTFLCGEDGNTIRLYKEADQTEKQQYEILPTEIVQVPNGNGITLYARLIKPANFDSHRKYPAVVMVYGGPHAQTVQNRWAGLSWDQVLAHKGFVVWGLDNRGSFGRGHAFETPVYHHLGITELADQKAGIAHLLSLGFVDGSRIGLYGWSYGGFMTLNTVVHAPGLIRAAVAGAPVTDWRNYDTIYTERYMGLPEENRDGYESTSPQAAADQLKAKLLIIHNIEDDNVHFANTMQMADALEHAGKDFRMLVYPQKSHGVTGPVRRQLYETMTAFFEDALH